MAHWENMLTKDVVQQMLHEGIYSRDKDIQENALNEQFVTEAKNGSTTSLNILYQKMKCGVFSEQRYKEISAAYHKNFQ